MTATTRLGMEAWVQKKNTLTFILRYTFNLSHPPSPPGKNQFQQHQGLDNFLEKHASEKQSYPLAGTKDFREYKLTFRPNEKILIPQE